MNAVRVAVVGVGEWAESHIQAWQSIPGVTISHLVGRSDLARTDALAERYGIATATVDLRESAEAGELDVLDVVTPPSYRLDALTLAHDLQISRVNLEKPIALSTGELEAVTDFAESHSAAVVVNHQKRFLPGIAWALKEIGSGRIGDVTVVSGTCRGAVHNQANHVLDLIGLFVDLSRVELTSATVSGDEGGTKESDDGRAVAITLEGPQTAVSLSIGENGRWISPGPYWMQVGVDVIGTKGSASFGINRSSLVLSDEAPHYASAETVWEADKVQALSDHLSFVLNGTTDELDAAFSRAVRANELLLAADGTSMR
jgi:predicted dehydrogenase